MKRDTPAGPGNMGSDADRPAMKQDEAVDAMESSRKEVPDHWHNCVLDHGRMEAAGCLTAGVAHGFNNVLQALLGGLTLAIGEVGPGVRKDLELAAHLGQQGRRLINDLLSFSCHQMLRPAASSLPSVLEELSRTLGRSFGRDVWVRVEAPPGLPPVLADAAHLDAALFNLALNAREAMPYGGELRIEAYAEGGRVVVAVSDNGGGMAPGVLARACEPFFTTKDVPGSGLGLSMVYGFARQSGGGLRIWSRQGEGTRVELLLPAAPSPVADATRSASGRVLVVDDQPEVRRVTAALLRKAGFEVTEACSGGDVLDVVMLSGPRFDVLITDYAMPGMDGVELVLQARETRPGLPALVISGHIGARQYGSGSGLEHLPADVEVLRKPFQQADIVSRVKRLIEGIGEEPR